MRSLGQNPTEKRLRAICNEVRLEIDVTTTITYIYLLLLVSLESLTLSS